ncbi:MAG: signal peptidase I [Hyphomonadaceae bacterium]
MNRRKLSLGLLTLSLVGGAKTAEAESWFRYHTFRQRSRSMQPTIQPGDRVRVRLGEATLGVADGNGLVQVNRGDCVAFVAPVWSDAIVIFRVIGLPGETILSIDQQGVLIDGVSIVREDAGPAPSDPSYYIDNPAPGPWREYEDARFVRESLPNGVSFLTLHTRPPGSFAARPARSPVVVPNDNVLVLGDARDNANDSRFELGMLPLSQVVGKVVSEQA